MASLHGLPGVLHNYYTSVIDMLQSCQGTFKESE